jgi:hypothetical protein
MPGEPEVLRTILAILAGLLVALATIIALEYLGMSLFPMPVGVTLQDETDLARLVAEAPTGKLLWVVLGWALAALLGGWTAARLSRAHRRIAALSVGGLIVAGVAATVATIPHPGWMVAAGLLLPLPLAWLAARLATRAAPTSDTRP